MADAELRKFLRRSAREMSRIRPMWSETSGEVRRGVDQECARSERPET